MYRPRSLFHLTITFIIFCTLLPLFNHLSSPLLSSDASLSLSSLSLAEAAKPSATASGVIDGEWDDNDDEDNDTPVSSSSSSSSHHRSTNNVGDDDDEFDDDFDHSHTPASTSSKSNKPSSSSDSAKKTSKASIPREDNDFDDEEDDEENEGGKNKKKGGVSGDSSSNGTPKAEQRFTFGSLVHDQSHFYYEYFAVGLLVLYAINYLIGSKENERMAKLFYENTIAQFQSQFAHIGNYDEVTLDQNNPSIVISSRIPPTKGWTGEGGIIKESASVFRFFCSGRRNCHGLLVTLNLRPRHCLFSLFLSLIDLANGDDSINIEIPMDDERFPLLVFALSKKKYDKKLRKAWKDLELFTTPSKNNTTTTTTTNNNNNNNNLPSGYSILTDCTESAEELIDDRLIKLLRDDKSAKLFYNLHITDQNLSYLSSYPINTNPLANNNNNNNTINNNNNTNITYVAHKKVLRFRFFFPSSKSDYSLLSSWINYCCALIDRIVDYRMSAASKEKAEKLRKKWAEKELKERKKEREEELKKQREEKKKQIEGTMDAEQLAKINKKKEEKKLKKSQGRVKIIR